MATVTIYGASDDLVEVEIIGGDGRKRIELDAYDRGRSISLRLMDGTGMQVYAEYSPAGFENAVWMIGVAQLDEDQAIPGWPMKYRMAENGYSPELMIQAPADVEVEYVD